MANEHLQQSKAVNDTFGIATAHFNLAVQCLSYNLDIMKSLEHTSDVFAEAPGDYTQWSVRNLKFHRNLVEISRKSLWWVFEILWKFWVTKRAGTKCRKIMSLFPHTTLSRHTGEFQHLTPVKVTRAQHGISDVCRWTPREKRIFSRHWKEEQVLVSFLRDCS